MKKSLIILALAMAVVLAFASPAFAKYAGFSSTTQYVPWATATDLASTNADAALMGSGPHAGYATTTVKCAVCHSVHRAGSKLLNEGAACAYCHTSTANGGGAVASDLISWNGGTNSGPHSSRCANTDCHGGPHGVGASTYTGAAARLLTAAGDAEMAELLAADTLVGGAVDMTTWNAESRVIGTAGVCQRAGCHENSMMGVVSAGATSTVLGVNKSVTGHRVIAAATAQWDGPAYGSKMTDKPIAFKPVDYCNSCHDLTDDNNAGKAAFPHAINDVVSAAQGKAAGTRPAVWLTAAPDSDTQSTIVGAYNDITGPDAGGGIIDGTCLKCHKSGTAGLGITY